MNKSKYSFIYYFIVVSVVLVASVIGSFTQYIIDYAVALKTSAPVTTDVPTIILDAGHGGEDSGAVGIDGTLEKDLNLMLCYQIRDVLTVHGLNVVMTREEDRLMYKESENIKGQRKHFDLKNRVEIARKHENVVFVSIHMNKFPSDKYKGMQVYYSRNNSNSKTLAQSIQTSTSLYLQTDNKRQIKDSAGKIYLLDMLECPAVLVECGFLSNADDCKALGEEAYRKKLALIISMSLIENIY